MKWKASVLWVVLAMGVVAGCSKPSNTNKGSSPGEVPANTTDSK